MCLEGKSSSLQQLFSMSLVSIVVSWKKTAGLQIANHQPFFLLTSPCRNRYHCRMYMLQRVRLCGRSRHLSGRVQLDHFDDSNCHCRLDHIEISTLFCLYPKHPLHREYACTHLAKDDKRKVALIRYSSDRSTHGFLVMSRREWSERTEKIQMDGSGELECGVSSSLS